VGVEWFGGGAAGGVVGAVGNAFGAGVFGCGGGCAGGLELVHEGGGDVWRRKQVSVGLKIWELREPLHSTKNMARREHRLRMKVLHTGLSSISPLPLDLRGTRKRLEADAQTPSIR